MECSRELARSRGGRRRCRHREKKLGQDHLGCHWLLTGMKIARRLNWLALAESLSQDGLRIQSLPGVPRIVET
eukprot:9474907-Pyramimonas_sp.AAC.1